ncbi:aspartyl-phosphate phosphatase Spo0E family protein [Paenibacillus sp. CAA11]|nr:aspartyl-phosphate phosphatase Spo0E family protein [Paenibacillus sp. CAA11]
MTVSYTLNRPAVRSKVNEDLLATIERLRSELVALSADRSFSSDSVLELSQRLDKYIVLAQRQMRKACS